MNPFDYTGPEFLLFYGALTATVILLTRGLRLLTEPRRPPPLPADDPYTIAYLRGGRSEAASLAMIVCVERGQLCAVGAEVAPPIAPLPQPTHPLERALCAAASAGGQMKSTDLAKRREVTASLDAIAAHAQRTGLVPSFDHILTRVALGTGFAVMLYMVAAHKLDLAAARGRHNTGILEVLAVLLPALSFVFAVVRRRTPAGDRTLRDLRSLLADSNDEGADEAQRALLTAVFGVTMLSATHHALSMKLFPETSSYGNSNSGSSCASSCGSSCGSGCGGGCGGCGG